MFSECVGTWSFPGDNCVVPVVTQKESKCNVSAEALDTSTQLPYDFQDISHVQSPAGVCECVNAFWPLMPPWVRKRPRALRRWHQPMSGSILLVCHPSVLRETAIHIVWAASEHLILHKHACHDKRCSAVLIQQTEPSRFRIKIHE